MTTGSNGQSRQVQALRERLQKLESLLAESELERRELLINERRYYALLNQCPIGIVVHQDGHIAYANKSAAHLAGVLDPEELVGRTIWDFVEDDRREHVRDKLFDFDPSDPLAEFNIEKLKRDDGAIIQAEVLAIPILMEAKPAILATIIDITDRNHREEQQRLHQSAISQTLRRETVSELCADLVHELSSPLFGISSITYSARSVLDSVPEAQRETIANHFNAIDEHAQRASTIANNLQAFCRTPPPHFEPTRLNDLIRSVAPVVEVESKRVHAVVQYRLNANPSLVMADKTLIEQVLVILAKNGLESMADVPTGDRRLTVETTLSDGSVETHLRDCGIGISDNTLEKVFDRFFTTKADGLGLGLAISKTIIESHGGRIWATANDGPGMSFHFSIPRASAP